MWLFIIAKEHSKFMPHRCHIIDEYITFLKSVAWHRIIIAFIKLLHVLNVAQVYKPNTCHSLNVTALLNTIVEVSSCTFFFVPSYKNYSSHFCV